MAEVLTLGKAKIRINGVTIIDEISSKKSVALYCIRQTKQKNLSVCMTCV